MKANLLDGLLTDAELAEELKVSERTVKRWRADGIGPPTTRFKQTPYTHIQSARDWIASREKRMPRDRGSRRSGERRTARQSETTA